MCTRKFTKKFSSEFGVSSNSPESFMNIVEKSKPANDNLCASYNQNCSESLPTIRSKAVTNKIKRMSRCEVACVNVCSKIFAKFLAVYSFAHRENVCQSM